MMIALSVEVSHKNSEFAFWQSLHAVCSVYHAHAGTSKSSLMVIKKHAISFALFFANGHLFLLNFGDIQQRLNHLQLV
jgi:hypothetical protein